MKKSTIYYIQSNIDGTFDIVQDTKTAKVVANTFSQEAASEIVRLLNSKIKNNEKL